MASSQILDGYWGNLKPEHKKAIEDVRAKLVNLPARYTDQLVLRFLRARGFDVPKAVEMLQNDVKWRAEWGVDEILETFKSNKYFKALTDYWPGGVYGFDKQNMPVYVERIGAVDPKSLLKQVPEDDLTKFHIYMMELTEHKMREAGKNLDLAVVDQGILYVQDLGQVSMKHMFPGGLSVVKNLTQLDQDHYPELLRRSILIHSPSIFGVLWKVISPWIDPRTVAKIEVLGSDYVAEFEKEGLNKNSMAPVATKGGMFGDVSEDATQVVVAAMDKFEHPVVIEKEESIIAWHFRTEDYNIGFSVFYENEKGQRKEMVTYTKYECHAEPVQNHFVAVLKGKYVLHWDNSFSFMRKKVLKYEVVVREPNAN